jgi:CelD/BcsL family acetyltransferase involved in cellulose biosynthesis
MFDKEMFRVLRTQNYLGKIPFFLIFQVEVTAKKHRILSCNMSDLSIGHIAPNAVEFYFNIR